MPHFWQQLLEKMYFIWWTHNREKWDYGINKNRCPKWHHWCHNCHNSCYWQFSSSTNESTVGIINTTPIIRATANGSYNSSNDHNTNHDRLYFNESKYKSKQAMLLWGCSFKYENEMWQYLHLEGLEENIMNSNAINDEEHESKQRKKTKKTGSTYGELSLLFYFLKNQKWLSMICY